jgi:Zn-dependent peptidase ImmA (M78 family)
MTPTRPRYARIRQLVDKLLTASGTRSAPVPVEKIAARMGAEIVFRDFDENVSGVLVRSDTAPVIGVATNQSVERQRFTIAHELGHLALHEGREVHVDKLFRINLRSPSSSRAEDVQEIEANAFAASLLMPRLFLHRDIASIELDFEDPSRILPLAQKYGVSVQAMTFRLLNLFGSSERA